MPKLRQIKTAERVCCCIRDRMATFLYHCPTTGRQVQGWTADDPTADGTFVTVACSACPQVHLVNPKLEALQEITDTDRDNRTYRSLIVRDPDTLMKFAADPDQFGSDNEPAPRRTTVTNR